jgi:hypothetical protein
MTDFLTEDDRKNPALVEAMEDFGTAGGLDALSADLVSLSTRVEGCQLPGSIGGYLTPDDPPTIDCRLRYFDGNWSFLTGDSSYDQDHRGHWGASCVGANLAVSEAQNIACDLVEQVLESIALSDTEEEN